MNRPINKRIVIIGGNGIVGKIEYNTLYKKFLPDILDYSGSLFDGKQCSFNEAVENMQQVVYDLAIVAVPTPFDEKSGILDCHYVYDAVEEVNAKIYLVKSTTNIGYCKYLSLVTGKHIVHSPEFAGDTQHCNNFTYNFTILGGAVEDCQVIQEIYQEVYDATHIFMYLNQSESEYTKFLENGWLATNVGFWTHAWEGAQGFEDICFEKVRQAVLLDPRIPNTHSCVYPSHPYYVSKCFDKDVPADANQTNNQFLKDVVKNNEILKQKYRKD